MDFSRVEILLCWKYSSIERGDDRDEKESVAMCVKKENLLSHLLSFQCFLVCKRVLLLLGVKRKEKEKGQSKQHFCTGC